MTEEVQAVVGTHSGWQWHDSERTNSLSIASLYVRFESYTDERTVR